MKITIIGFLWFVTSTLSAVVPWSAHAASLACKTPDHSFNVFLSKFKSNRKFNEERVTYPLKKELAGNINFISKAEYQKQNYASKLQNGTVVPYQRCKLIDQNGRCADTDFLRRGTCEFSPEKINGELVVVKIFSCGEEEFGTDYQFSLKSGCWYLSDLSSYGN